MIKRYFVFLAAILLAFALASSQSVHACGGLFCQNSPVDQNAERIIFTQNGNGTVTAIIQIQYTGFAEDFSWILPIPEPITAEALEVPETATNAFIELETATNPVFIAPPPPACAQVMVAESAAEAEGGVEVFASGEVGPFGFDVIGSEDPNALINWLRENNYQVTPEMEPLINVYVQEQFVFLAMRLLPDQGVQDIQPIQVTYPSERPMIPLRLTAVAANPDMAVLTWIFANAQAVPVNYAHMEIPDQEITFFTFGGNNYRQLMGEKANEFNGQAFITEFAGPTREMNFIDPLLQELSQQYSYLTRLNTVISPEEMTVDPIFDYDPNRANVFNVHDLSNMSGLYDCEREEVNNLSTGLSNLFGNNNNDPDPTTAPPASGEESSFSTGVAVGVGGVLVAAGLLGAGVMIGRRGRSS
jgi:hypothetical protein